MFSLLGPTEEPCDFIVSSSLRASEFPEAGYIWMTWSYLVEQTILGRFGLHDRSKTLTLFLTILCEFEIHLEPKD